MLELVECRALAARRAPLLLNGEHKSLAVRDGGREVMHVLTGVDRRFNRVRGRRQGYFALFDGEDRPDAAALLFEGVAAFQRALGNETLFGPVAPDGGGFLAGIQVDGFDRPPEPMNPNNPAYYEALLLGAGFTPSVEWLGFELDLDALARRRYAEAADWFMRRHGVSVEALNLRAGRRAYALLYEAMELGGRVSLSEFAARLDAVRPTIGKRLLLLATAQGTPAGMLLALHDPGRKTVRLATLHVAARFRGTPVALSLLGVFVRNAGLLRPERVTASVIDGANAASIACAVSAGGRQCARWRQYQREI